MHGTRMDHLPLVLVLCRYRFAVMGVLGTFMVVAGSQHLGPSNDWQYFTWGSQVLFGSDETLRIGGFVAEADGLGGLHLFAEHPFLQIGPPALLLAALLQVGPGDGIYVAGAVIQAMALTSVWCIDRAFRDRGRHLPLTVLLGGSLVTVVWGSLSHYRHLDDALTLTCLAAASLALTRERWVSAGLLLGLGAAAKPWGVVVLVLVLVAPRHRDRLHALLAALGVLIASWAPFVLADPATLGIGTYHLTASAGSPLAVLGLSDALGQSWLRPVQFLLGAFLAGWLVHRGRWPAAALVAFSLRLLLDPNVYPYYSAGIVLAALLVDTTLMRCRLPLLTIWATMSWLATLTAPESTALGWARVTTYVVLVIAAVRVGVVSSGPSAMRLTALSSKPREATTAAAPS